MLRDQTKDSHLRSQLPLLLGVEAQNTHVQNSWFRSWLALGKF